MAERACRICTDLDPKRIQRPHDPKKLHKATPIASITDIVNLHLKRKKASK